MRRILHRKKPLIAKVTSREIDTPKEKYVEEILREAAAHADKSGSYDWLAAKLQARPLAINLVIAFKAIWLLHRASVSLKLQPHEAASLLPVLTLIKRAWNRPFDGKTKTSAIVPGKQGEEDEQGLQSAIVEYGNFMDCRWEALASLKPLISDDWSVHTVLNDGMIDTDNLPQVVQAVERLAAVSTVFSLAVARLLENSSSAFFVIHVMGLRECMIEGPQLLYAMAKLLELLRESISINAFYDSRYQQNIFAELLERVEKPINSAVTQLNNILECCHLNRNRYHMLAEVLPQSRQSYQRLLRVLSQVFERDMHPQVSFFSTAPEEEQNSYYQNHEKHLGSAPHFGECGRESSPYEQMDTGNFKSYAQCAGGFTRCSDKNLTETRKSSRSLTKHTESSTISPLSSTPGRITGYSSQEDAQSSIKSPLKQHKGVLVRRNQLYSSSLNNQHRTEKYQDAYFTPVSADEYRNDWESKMQPSEKYIQERSKKQSLPRSISGQAVYTESAQSAADLKIENEGGVYLNSSTSRESRRKFKNLSITANAENLSGRTKAAASNQISSLYRHQSNVEDLTTRTEPYHIDNLRSGRILVSSNTHFPNPLALRCLEDQYGIPNGESVERKKMLRSLPSFPQEPRKSIATPSSTLSFISPKIISQNADQLQSIWEAKKSGKTVHNNMRKEQFVSETDLSYIRPDSPMYTPRIRKSTTSASMYSSPIKKPTTSINNCTPRNCASTIRLEKPVQQLQASVIHAAVRPSDMRINKDTLVMSAAEKAIKRTTGKTKPESSKLCVPELLVNLEDIRIDVLVGRGATSQVFRGTWRGTMVAVKVIQCDASEAARLGRRVGTKKEFYRELGIMLRLRHPNLVLFMGANTYGNSLCVLTEYCAGVSSAPRRVLTWSQKVKICYDIAKACQYLHSSKPAIIHRDLKSLNVLLVSPIKSDSDIPQAKVSDFGLSRIKSGPGGEWGHLTGMAGTYHWMAPEVILNQPYDEKADVYSYGIVMFEVITQSIPYCERSLRRDQVPSPVSIAIDVTKGKRPDTRLIPASCPKVLIALMKNCWRDQAKERPSFRRIVEVLAQLC